MSPPRLDLVHLAIRSGLLGHIQWKDAADRLVRRNPPLPNLVPEVIRALLRQFVVDGGLLDVRIEVRQEYLRDDPDDPYWYRAIIPVTGLPQGLFVEVKLVDSDPVEPWVEIVSAHRQES
jgi:hypothetical protein